jgi:hypothetical protein
MGLVAGATLALPAWTFAAGITGSPHDFQSRTWNTSKSACGVCHTIHGSAEQQVPLWAHKSTEATFTAYTSPTLDAQASTGLSGSSRACLSCHDGTVAVNNFGGMIQGGSAELIDPVASLGTDLSDDHPVGIVYDSALAVKDGFLKNPETTLVTGPDFTGTRTISQEMLRAGRLECVSCHDVHKERGAAKNSAFMLLMDGPSYAGSKLCLTCHIK